jgi:pseudouridine-5'-phosphate glycosidase
VPVFAYGSATFPAFYLLDSGSTARSITTPLQAAQIAQMHWALGNGTGLVVGNPIPTDEAIPPAEWAGWLAEAASRAARDGISGQAVTPYLLAQVAEISGGRTVRANIALLVDNARLAAEVAVALHT